MGVKLIFPKTELLPMLMEESLWLVMDPWRYQPHVDRTHGVNYLNAVYAEKINYYLQNVKFKSISLPKLFEPNPIFSNWINLRKPRLLHEFMKDNNLSKITYCGFHHGVCILVRETGAIKMSEFYTCYLKHDLSCSMFSSDNHIEYEEYDNESAKYMTFV